MNKSRVVSTLKLQNGLYTITLPFKDPITNQPQDPEVIINTVLDTITTPMYSQFEPWIQEEIINIKNMRKDERQPNTYVLPPHLTTTPVIEVFAKPHNVSKTDGVGYINPAYSMYSAARTLATMTEYKMLASQMADHFTTVYKGNNRINIQGFLCKTIELTVAAEHQSNLETIEQGCYDSYMQLATLDLQMFLWNTLKMYNNIPTAFGEVQLKIDQFERAEDSRNELLNLWRDTSHLDKWYYTNFV